MTHHAHGHAARMMRLMRATANHESIKCACYSNLHILFKACQKSIRGLIVKNILILFLRLNLRNVRK